MNKIITSITTICILLGLSFNALANDNGAGKHYVLNLVGTGAMYESYLALDEDGIADDLAFCFDVDLYNAKNQQLIGTATDCLSNITEIDTGLALIGTTTFDMPQGKLVIRGYTTVQPVLQIPTTTPAGQDITHITGAAGTGNAVIHGTGLFAGATGTARLSGMVNLSSFAANKGDPISFDCLFVIDLDYKQ